MLNYCDIYILDNLDNGKTGVSFVSEIFNLNSFGTITLELNNNIMELIMAKWPNENFKLDIIKNFINSIPMYLNCRAISGKKTIYFLTDKITDYNDLYICNYTGSSIISQKIIIKEIETNAEFIKYQIGWDGKIIEQNLLIHLLEWILVKNEKIALFD